MVHFSGCAAPCMVLWIAGLLNARPATALAYDPLGEVKGLIRNRLDHLHRQAISETDPAEWCKDQQAACDEKVKQAQLEFDTSKGHLQAAGGDPDSCLYGKRPSPSECYELHAASDKLELHRKEQEALARNCAGRTYGSSYEERQQRREHLIDRLSEAHELLR
mmetsp:Transcript_27221/g.49976  ORF Transcript_27221/g.49976 Transcript_27221/m.49976 type:complete len:163 (-) Transcript_27221:35-523(-)